MTTALVVPVFNGAHVLPRTVPAALAVGADETVYVDDGSTDGTADVLARLTAGRPDVRVVRHERNRGRAAARNTGADGTAGSALLFCDADVAPRPGYLAAHRAALTDEGAVASVGLPVPQDLDPSEPYHRYFASARRGPQAAGRADWKHFVTNVSAVSREAFRAAGGFDERVRYGEDLALGCALAARHPDGLRFAPGARADLFDVGTLATVRAHLAVFAADLARTAERCPEVYRVAGLDRLVSSRPADRAVAAAARWRLPATVAGRAVGRVPAAWAVPLVRYLLGHTVAVHLRDAPGPRPRP